MKFKTVTQNGIVVQEAYVEPLRGDGLDAYERLMSFTGGTHVKKKANRSVVKFTCGGKVFFLKRHVWEHGEGLKRLLKLPNLEDGRNEWDMTIALKNDGFLTPEPVAYGEETKSGIVKSSLYLSEEVYGATRLSDYLPSLSGVDAIVKKRSVMRDMGFFAKRFHEFGYNHQDFYLLHIFYRPDKNEFIIVDLQRVHKRARPVRRWVLKDLAQLAFSVGLVKTLTFTDLVRFWKAYFGVKRFDKEHKKMIKNIMQKAKRIKARDSRRRSAPGGYR